MKMISQLFSTMRQRELVRLKYENETLRSLHKAGIGMIGLV